MPTEPPVVPGAPDPVGQPVNRVDWFRRIPGGGTAHVVRTGSESED